MLNALPVRVVAFRRVVEREHLEWERSIRPQRSGRRDNGIPAAPSHRKIRRRSERIGRANSENPHSMDSNTYNDTPTEAAATNRRCSNRSGHQTDLSWWGGLIQPRANSADCTTCWWCFPLVRQVNGRPWARIEAVQTADIRRRRNSKFNPDRRSVNHPEQSWVFPLQASFTETRRYRSTKEVDDEGWHHETVDEFQPLNQKYQTICISAEDAGDISVIGEFVGVIGAPHES